MSLCTTSIDHLQIYLTLIYYSEILYPKEACSPHSGVSGEHLSKGRDYVVGFLFLLNKKHILQSLVTNCTDSCNKFESNPKI